VQCNRVRKNDADEVMCLYSECAAACLTVNDTFFVNFDPVKSRVDSLMQQDISSLEASAHALLTNAEAKHAMKCVTEANSCVTL